MPQLALHAAEHQLDMYLQPQLGLLQPQSGVLHSAQFAATMSNSCLALHLNFKYNSHNFMNCRVRWQWCPGHPM